MHEMTTNFTLHPQLVSDTVTLGYLPLCQVLLINNKEYPWVTLVPQEADIDEITDLVPEKRSQLMEEISLISAMMRQIYAPDKINVAALGNIVPQLHIHIIARYKTDKVWPNPVWGHETTAYEDTALRDTVKVLQDAFGDIMDFMRPN